MQRPGDIRRLVDRGRLVAERFLGALVRPGRESVERDVQIDTHGHGRFLRGVIAVAHPRCHRRSGFSGSPRTRTPPSRASRGRRRARPERMASPMPRCPAERATDREVGVAASLVAGSEKAAAHRLGLSHSTVKHHLANTRSMVGATTTAQLVWILAPRLPEPDHTAPTTSRHSTGPKRAGPGRWAVGCAACSRSNVTVG